MSRSGRFQTPKLYRTSVRFRRLHGLLHRKIRLPFSATKSYSLRSKTFASINSTNAGSKFILFSDQTTFSGGNVA
jgi:hypothetical protein